MPAIITDRFRIHNSEQFSEAFSEAAGNTFYLGIGRPQPFAVSTRADGRTNNEGTDAAPITPADNTTAQTFPFDDLIAFTVTPLSKKPPPCVALNLFELSALCVDVDQPNGLCPFPILEIVTSPCNPSSVPEL